MSKVLGASLLPILLAASSLPAYASKEGPIPWSTFSMQAPGRDGSGPVAVSGIFKDGEVMQFTVKAFGRSVELDAAQRARLKGLLVNGLDVTYEPGIGGKDRNTLYIGVSQVLNVALIRRSLIEVTRGGQVRITQVPVTEGE